MINTGTRLGPCEVLGPLGAGGMGEVYRARDTRLERTVGIKVLPSSVSSDPDRLKRFESREIQGQVVRTFKPSPLLREQLPAGFAVAVKNSESYKRFVESVAGSSAPA